MPLSSVIYECPYGHVFASYFQHPKSLPIICHLCATADGSSYTCAAYSIDDPIKISIFRLGGAFAYQEYLAEEKKKKYPHPCEWNPMTDRGAKPHEVHAQAAWVVNARPRGLWKLCGKCAAVGRFSEFDRWRPASFYSW